MAYTEADTRAKLIDPQIKSSHWLESHIVREYYFTDGRKLIGGARGKQYYVDYLLSFQNTNLAIIEAKAENKDPLDGLQQSINYAQKLKIDFVYTTNGHKIYEHNLITGKGDWVENYPTPSELFERKFPSITESKEKIIKQPFHFEGNMKPRYYQQIAVDKTLESIANGKGRVLLTLATGTGKTYIAFQIVYRLFEARWSREGVQRRPKVLFLADRNVLADQAFNTFNPLEKDIVRVNGKEIKNRGGRVPTNANVFFAIYQSIAERKSDEFDEENDVTAYYKQYPSNFFDLVVIDECHRGSANDESSWRDILDHFGSAVHLGLTATPKRDDNGDTYKYFGDPVYEYSLKEGINDGFLTPYKVKRIQTNIDEYRFNPNDIITGELANQIVELDQFEKQVVIPKRTELIAKTILEQMNPMDKTIIFCVNQKHAIDMKIAIDKYKTVKDNDYCVRVTSDEGEIGRDFLEAFQNNDRDIPTILTSSKMLTTGVDAKNVRNVVLTAPIRSMTEFKQIIGRGTRVFEGKDFFTIIDFVGATNLFYDDAWDGLPEEKIDDITTVDEGKGTDTVQEPEEPYGSLTGSDTDITKPESVEGKEKVTIEIKGRKLKVIDIETTYVGEDGIPLKTHEFLEFLVGILDKFFHDEAQLRELWSDPLKREELLEKLRAMHIDEVQLEELKSIFEAEESDIYDVLAHLSFNLDIKTRSDRAFAVHYRKYIEKYHSDKVREFLDFILERYKKDGVKEMGSDKLSSLIKLSGMELRELKEAFSVDGTSIREGYFGLQKEIYR